MRNKINIYIIISVIVGFLLVALLGWALFLNEGQLSLQKDAEESQSLFVQTRDKFNIDVPEFGNVIEKIQKEDKEQDDTGDTTDKQNTFVPEIKQLHDAPIAGLYTKPGVIEGEDVLYFTERSTGHVFELRIKDGIPQTQRVLYTTVPGVQESLWTDDGGGVIRRYIDESGAIASVYSRIGAEEDVSGYLIDNILTMAINNSGDTLFYIVAQQNGAYGYTSNPDGSDAQLIWTSYITGWSAVWIDNTSILLTQKPTADEGGAAFIIDTKGGNEEYAISKIPGLITNISPDNDRLLYSGTYDNAPVLFVKNMKDKTHVPLSVSTFADKCVWDNTDANILYCFAPENIPRAQYPDAWYMSTVKFNDSLWRIHTDTGEAELLLSPLKENTIGIDAQQLVMSSSGAYLFFINKTNQTLWYININNNG